MGFPPPPLFTSLNTFRPLLSTQHSAGHCQSSPTQIIPWVLQGLILCCAIPDSSFPQQNHCDNQGTEHRNPLHSLLGKTLVPVQCWNNFHYLSILSCECIRHAHSWDMEEMRGERWCHLEKLAPMKESGEWEHPPYCEGKSTVAPGMSQDSSRKPYREPHFKAFSWGNSVVLGPVEELKADWFNITL